MKVKFVLSMLFIAATLIAAIWQKVIPFLSSGQPPASVFTVQMKDGETIEVTNARLHPTFGGCANILSDWESIPDVILSANMGRFALRKDFQGVERIDVLGTTKTHTLLRITFQDGEVLEGKREYIHDIREETWDPLDFLCGKSGKLDVDIGFTDIASITRKGVDYE